MAVTSESVYGGAKAPEALEVTINQGTSGLDLTTVTAVVLEVTKPGGTVVNWTASIGTQVTTQIVCTYTFDSGGGDVPIEDAGVSYRIMPQLTVAGGTRRAEPFLMPIIK